MLALYKFLNFITSWKRVFNISLFPVCHYSCSSFAICSTRLDLLPYDFNRFTGNYFHVICRPFANFHIHYDGSKHSSLNFSLSPLASSSKPPSMFVFLILMPVQENVHPLTKRNLVSWLKAYLFCKK